MTDYHSPDSLKIGLHKRIHINSLWEHLGNGNVYKVIMFANLTSGNPNYPITIIYRNEVCGTVWAKPIDNFLNKLKPLAGN